MSRYTTSCILSDRFSASSGVRKPEDRGSGVPGPLPGDAMPLRGLARPLPRPGIGVTNPLGGAAALIPSGEAGTISGGRSGILMRLASLL